jgi:hypothetical protein
MKVFARLLACSVFLCLTAPLALADSTYGNINLSGGASFDTSLLSFPSPFASNADTGLFAPFSGGTVDYFLGTVVYMNGIYLPAKTFSVTAANGDVLTFYDAVNDASQSADPITGNLDISLHELGSYTIDGGPAMAGYFQLNLFGGSPVGSDGIVSFAGSGGLTSFVPEPATYALLGSGLIGLAGLLRRRNAEAVV